MTDIILTGLPRSGTTLTVSLLNKLPNIVALHEPMEPAQFVGLGRVSEIPKAIQSFFDEQRQSLLDRGTATSRGALGKIPDNPFQDEKPASGSREHTTSVDQLTIEKALTANFSLVIKHPNFFTALLDVLPTHFRCYAVIRNPLSVLLSWNSIDAPVQNGRAPFAEAFDNSLAEKLLSEADKTQRQLILIDWYFQQYQSHLSADHIVRYEDIVTSGGKILSIITPTATTLNEALQSKNQNPLYDHAEAKRLADALLASDGCQWNFYSPDDIYRVLN